MPTLHFVDAEGRYLGGFDGATPPVGAALVQTAPPDGRATWNGSEWVMPVIVPPTISKVQFVRALRALNMWETHRALIEAYEDWDLITEIPRDDPATVAMGQAMGATPEQMDAIWILGATL